MGYYGGLEDHSALRVFENAQGPAVLILTSQAGAQGLSIKGATYMLLGDIPFGGEDSRWTQIQQRMCRHSKQTRKATVPLCMFVVAAQQPNDNMKTMDE